MSTTSEDGVQREVRSPLIAGRSPLVAHVDDPSETRGANPNTWRQWLPGSSMFYVNRTVDEAVPLSVVHVANDQKERRVRSSRKKTKKLLMQISQL